MLRIQQFSDSFFEDRSDYYFEKKKKLSCINDYFGYKALTGSEVNSKMPVDFASYLMSSSPPGFSLYNALSVNGFNHFGNSLVPLKPILTKTSESDTNGLSEVASNDPLKSDSPVCVCYTCKNQSDFINGCLFNALVDVENGCGDDSEDEVEIDIEDLECECRRLSIEDSADSSEGETRVTRYTARFPKKKKKRVTFADCNGLSLTEVRIMTERSGSPPNLRPQLLASLTDGALPGVTEIPPLKLDFSQPASDYYAFREKLKCQSVSLENVILKDYNVLGTIKVRNLSFKKTVTLRVTFDSWKTFTDVKANYVPCGDNAGSLQYDTFAFEIHVPSVLSRNQPVEFCIHYRCDCADFWDNNDGRNYRIVTVDYNDESSKMPSQTPDSGSKFSNTTPEVWSEYSSWQVNDAETPYY